MRTASAELVFMDVSMPEMDGITAAVAIRGLGDQHPNSQVPIIALTAHALEEDRQRFLAAGMTEVLTKPLDMGAMLQLLRRYQPGSEGTPPAGR